MPTFVKHLPLTRSFARGARIPVLGQLQILQVAPRTTQANITICLRPQFQHYRSANTRTSLAASSNSIKDLTPTAYPSPTSSTGPSLRISSASMATMAEPVNHREAPHAKLVTENLERPLLDTRSYRVIRLSNQLESLLIHDAETDKGSAALDVNVGSFSDADDMPGIAHAVEHLLFMGTEKFPKENAYNQYLTAHSGSSNAFTASTSTNYYFEVAATNSVTNSKAKSANSSTSSVASKDEAPLYGALDRFAQFFVKPLFLADTLDRELRAVDSENKKNLQSDTWRLHQLNKTLSNPNHPYCHFSTGSYKTLHDEPLKRGEQIRDRFIKFYQENYSANRMKLVVLGRESLDELQSWVEELFSEVPNKDYPKNRWDDVSPYTENELLMQVFAKPVFDMRVLDFYFPYQDEENMYDSQPNRYISHLLGHEGPGSVLAYIKEKGWANGLGAGSLPLCPGSAFFSVSVRLTEEGLNNYKEVAKTIFQYIAMLKEQPPQKWVMDELINMSEVDFRFKQKTPASSTTCKLSGHMQKPYPREMIISGGSVIRKFDPEGIQKGLSYLRPDNFRITVVSQDFPGEWDHKEKWYGTEYTYEKIPKDFLEEIESAYSSKPNERPAELHLPHKNEFIPTRLDVEKKEVDRPAKHPTLIRNDEVVRTWFKKDDRFWVPKANLHFTFRTPLANITPENHVLCHLYRELVADALVEYSYAAEISGLEYSLVNHSVGLDITITGYNDKMHVLLEKVLDTIRNIEIREDRFNIVKERLLRGFKNWDYSQPYHQIGTYSRWLINDKGWINDQYLAELPVATVEEVRAFYPQLLHQMHIEVLAHGNLYKEDVLKMTDMIESALKPRPLPPNQWPIRRTLVFPPGSNYVYNKPLKDPANVNHCIEYHLFVGSNQDSGLRAKAMAFGQITDEPAFDQLRTKEQLGYVVFSGPSLFSTSAGYRILIQSEKSPDYLEKRIDAFLTRFGETLKDMTESEFEGHKRSLINRRLERLKHLTQESNRFWNAVMSEIYDFEQHEQDAEHIAPLTLKDMKEFYHTFIDPKSEMRAKLSVHLVAQSSAKPEEQAVKFQELLGNFLSSEGVAVDEAQLQSRLKDITITSPSAAEDIISAVTAFLIEDRKVDKLRVKAIVEMSKGMLPNMLTSTEGEKSIEGSNGVMSAGKEPTVITDVHAFKAGLQVSAGAKPVKELSEFEDLEPKL